MRVKGAHEGEMRLVFMFLLKKRGCAKAFSRVGGGRLELQVTKGSYDFFPMRVQLKG